MSVKRYKIPEDEFKQINENFPMRFGHLGRFEGEYFYNIDEKELYDFDYDAIFQNLFGMTLDNYILSKDPEDIDQPKIYRYTNKQVKKKHFHDINYKTELTISLVPVRTFEKGELVKVIRGDRERVRWLRD